jgi:glycerol-3-phosphate dehydrogenase (NAD(P)+)
VKLGVIGAGAWGTALAQVAAAGGEEVLLWAREAEVVEAVNGRHENTLFLNGVPLAETIRATADLAELAECEAFLIVTPAQHLRAVLGGLAARGRPLVLCAKGIEDSTGLLMHEVAHQVQPDSPIAVLSGPTFAHEVAAGLPTAVTLAVGDKALGERLVERIARPAFRPYLSDDIAGAEVGGAVKNVLAIAAGLADGLGYGHNARAALITRGLAEISRLAVAEGGRRETLMGLAGLGDLVLTCTGSLSRNRHVGIELAHGRRLADVLAGMKMIAEGVNTTNAALALGARHGVELPIATQMAAVLAGESDVRTAVEALMLRRQRAEN